MVAGEQVAGLTINRYFGGLSCSARFLYCLCYHVTIDYWYRRVTLRLNKNVACKGGWLGFHYINIIHIVYMSALNQRGLIVVSCL